MKIAVLAEQNFNLIDGSTIWLLNVCKLLGMQKDLDTHLLLTHALDTPVLAQELPSSIKLHDARKTLKAANINDSQLRPETVGPALVAWEAAHGRFDRIFVRGTAYLTQLLQDPDLHGRLVAYAPSVLPDISVADPPWIETARNVRVPIVIQSEAGKRALETLFDYPAHVVHVVPPIVFPTAPSERPAKAPAVLCYSGKIDLYYGMDWLIDLARRNANDPDIAFSLIAGKDTYRAKNPEFFVEMDRFRTDIGDGVLPQVQIVSNVPHSEAKAIMARADFAFCLRHDRYDDVIEISTKIVEFCTMDVPPILNDNALNRDLFGDDYPYYVDISREDVPTRVLDILRGHNSETYAAAQAQIADVAAQFSADALSDRLARAIRGSGQGAPLLTAEPRHIHVATHDRKFLSQFLDFVAVDNKITVSFEPWESTVKPAVPPQIPGQADTVFCEWCCENAVWHSRHKRAGSKLIVRLHRFELFRDFPRRVDWSAVDALIVVSDYFKSRMQTDFDVPPEKIHVIPQYIDWNGLRRSKLPEARFTLGLVCINPFEHKRFDRALDFFIRLRARDPRFKLAVRSVMPWEIDWVWNKNDETRSKFEAVFRRIYDDRDLAAAIRFDPAGPDMEEWFRGIGTILSSSDTEGCHTAVMEGMASGCLPVVYAWPGAASLFAPYVHEAMPAAIPDVMDFAREDSRQARDAIARRVAKHDVEQFAQDFMAL